MMILVCSVLKRYRSEAKGGRKASKSGVTWSQVGVFSRGLIGPKWHTVGLKENREI